MDEILHHHMVNSEDWSSTPTLHHQRSFWVRFGAGFLAFNFFKVSNFVVFPNVKGGARGLILRSASNGTGFCSSTVSLQAVLLAQASTKHPQGEISNESAPHRLADFSLQEGQRRNVSIGAGFRSVFSSDLTCPLCQVAVVFLECSPTGSWFATPWSIASRPFFFSKRKTKHEETFHVFAQGDANRELREQVLKTFDEDLEKFVT